MLLRGGHRCLFFGKRWTYSTSNEHLWNITQAYQHETPTPLIQPNNPSDDPNAPIKTAFVDFVVEQVAARQEVDVIRELMSKAGGTNSDNVIRELMSKAGGTNSDNVLQLMHGLPSMLQGIARP